MPDDRKPASVLHDELMMLVQAAVAQGSVRVTSQPQSTADESDDATVQRQHRVNVIQNEFDGLGVHSGADAHASRAMPLQGVEGGVPGGHTKGRRQWGRESGCRSAPGCGGGHGEAVGSYPQRKQEPNRVRLSRIASSSMRGIAKFGSLSLKSLTSKITPGTRPEDKWKKFGEQWQRSY